MKKLVALLLAAVMMLPLAACAGGAQSAETHAETHEETHAETAARTESFTTAPETQAETMPPETEEEPTETVQEVEETPVYDPDFRVTSYIVIEEIQGDKTFDTSHISKLTDIILIGNAKFDQNGQVVLSEGTPSAIQKVQEAIEGLPIRLHINLTGPGALVSDPNDWLVAQFSMGDEHKKAFDSGVLEQNILETLQTYDLDGIFFDWEFPYRDEDKVNFSEFLISLDQTLGDEYVIGAAVTFWCADFAPEAKAVLDMVEIMCYDLWDSRGYHAPLSFVTEHIELYKNMGYELSQIDVGLPFYARPTTQEGYWYSYRDFYNQLTASGLYNDPVTGLVFSFNTPSLIEKKTKIAVKKKCGGMMVWHYTYDVSGDNEASLFSVIKRVKDEAGLK